MRGPLDHARALLNKAGNDLIAGGATLATGEALDTVCFHAQQAVEKSLKALLALDDVEYPRRHDLGELVALVKLRVPEIGTREEGILTLAPYAVAARYDEAFAPELSEARAALDLARQVHEIAVKTVERRAGS